MNNYDSSFTLSSPDLGFDYSTDIPESFDNDVILPDKLTTLHSVWLYDNEPDAAARVNFSDEFGIYSGERMRKTDSALPVYGQDYLRTIAPEAADEPLSFLEATFKADPAGTARYQQEFDQLRNSGKDSKQDYYALVAKMVRNNIQDQYNQQQQLITERQQGLTGLLKNIVDSGNTTKYSEPDWVQFFDAKARGVFSDQDEESLHKATNAFSMMKGYLRDTNDAGAKVLTNASTAQLIMDYIKDDELAEALFYNSLQTAIQDAKTTEEERNFAIQFANALDASGQQLAAGLMGGHFKAFVTDEQVDEYNARKDDYLSFNRTLLSVPGETGSSGFSGQDYIYFASIEAAARESGQMNEDGSLRKMTDAERDATVNLDAFRGKLYNAVSGLYDISGPAAKIGKMLPSSAVYLVPGGIVAAAASMRTQDLANQLGEGADYITADTRASVNALIQSTVEKFAFGSLKPSRMAFGLDKFMQLKPVARTLGKLYGTTAGRIGMGVAAGTLEETFAEPALGLLLGGLYNAIAPTQLELESPTQDFLKEVEEMTKPDQLLATVIYGLLIGGVSYTGHKAAAQSYQDSLSKLTKLGVDEGKAAAASRITNPTQRKLEQDRLIQEQVKKDLPGVLAYIAEQYPQLQDIVTFQTYYANGQLPTIIPSAEEGQVIVQEKDADGNVTETPMAADAAQLFLQARLESLTVSEQLKIADAVLANAMVGAISQDSDRWDVELVNNRMDIDYFANLATAARLRIANGADPNTVDPSLHPSLSLGSLAYHGTAWQQRMAVARNEFEQKHGKISDEQWQKLEKTIHSKANRTMFIGSDKRLKTLLRVARGGFGAREILEEVTEDNLKRDMQANNRTLEFYTDNLRELEIALGKQGEFIRALNEGETYNEMDVIEGVGKLVQAKVLADTAKPGNGLSAALNAFLDLLRRWMEEVAALFRLGQAVNQVLTNPEASKNIAPEFVDVVNNLAIQDIEFLKQLQFTEGLAAAGRAYARSAQVYAAPIMQQLGINTENAATPTPIMDAAEAEHGQQVRSDMADKEKTQAKVDADIAAAQQAIDDPAIATPEPAPTPAPEQPKAKPTAAPEITNPKLQKWVDDDIAAGTKPSTARRTAYAIAALTSGKKNPRITEHLVTEARRIAEYVSRMQRSIASHISRAAKSQSPDLDRWYQLQATWQDSVWPSNPHIISDARAWNGTSTVSAELPDSPSMSMSVTDAQEQGMFEEGVLEASNAVVTAPSFSIEALHATPHRFRKFDTSKMGSGEGNQAFGWGLYFAEYEGTNEWYYQKFERMGLGRKVYTVGGKEYSLEELRKTIRRRVGKLHNIMSLLACNSMARANKEKFTAEDFAAFMKQRVAQEKRSVRTYENRLKKKEEALERAERRGHKPTITRMRNELDDIKQWHEQLKEDYEDAQLLYAWAQKGGFIENVSRMPISNLRVELNANDSNLLMWDEKVPAELHETVRELRSGQPVKGLVISMPNASEMTWPGYRIYSELTSVLGTPKAASEWLAERGYKGIKYLDGMSRRAGEGTYNYVIFSGDDVKITGVNETGDYNAPWEEYEDVDASFSVEGVTPELTPETEAYAEHNISFNVVSAIDPDSREYQREMLLKQGRTKEEVEATFAILDGIVDGVIDIGKSIPEFAEWQAKDVQRYLQSNSELLPIVSSFKKNGDYEINIDLGTICVKREMMTMLTDILAKKGLAGRLGVSQVEQIKDIFKEYGIATACDVCFVESRRIRALSQAQQLVFYWNTVREAVGITGNELIGTHGDLSPEQREKLERLSNKQDFDLLIPKKHHRVKSGKADADLGITADMAAKVSKLFLEAPALAGKASLGDFMSMSRTDYLIRTFGFRSGIRGFLGGAFGAATAKPQEAFNTYDTLSWKKIFGNKSLEELRSYLFAIGGGRVQSFTDFNPALFLDYFQMVCDFAWRGLPMQAYTKVPEFVALFGLTGIKMNMSLLPAVDTSVDADHAGLTLVNGQYQPIWHKDSFPTKLAFEYRKDPRFHANVGTIVVGISDAHILALLDMDEIDMVIPYHRSGMPNATQIKTGLNFATDYTDVQNTRIMKVSKVKRKKGKQTIEEEKIKFEKAPDTFSYNETLQRLKDPRAAANAYLAYCDENGFTPKFDRFRNHPNYYKLLEDFRGYDSTGHYAPQQALTTTLPEDWSETLTKALGTRVSQVEKMQNLLNNAEFMQRIESVLEQTPLEGELRTAMMKRINSALGGTKDKQMIEYLPGHVFEPLLRDFATANMAQDDAARQKHLLRLHNGVVYGFVNGNRIYLRESTFNANTPAHEFTHIWARVAQHHNPKLWKKGVKLLEQTEEWQQILSDPLYFSIWQDKNAMASEVLARRVGQHAEERIQELMDPTRKPLKEKGLQKQILKWLKDVWNGIRSFFDLSSGVALTLEEFEFMPLVDIFDENRNKAFKARLAEYKKTTKDQPDSFSLSVTMDEEQLLTPIAAAGQGFKANAAFAEHMEQEMRSSILRMKKLSSKVRTEREDAIAAMGTMIHAAKAIVQYLPEGYRFNVRPYLNKLEVLAEIATTGTISLTEDIASKDIKSWLHKQHQEHAQLTLNAADGGVQVDSTVDEIIKEFGSLKLTLAMERITDRVAAQLRKHAKDQVATKIKELIDKLAPKVDPKTGKLKGGKMGADDYRDLAEVSKALDMTADALQAEISATETEMAAPDITEEQHARLENKLVLLTNFGNLDGMTPEEAHAAYDALRARIYAARFAWENTLADRRIARRRMVNKIVEGVGQIGQNEYNARKRTQKTSRRLKTAVDIVKGAPQALASLRGYLPMREMVDNLLARINNAGELLKQWQRERWTALEILSQQTLGKSWRECMDLMHSVNPTGVAFDRPVYEVVDIRVDDLLPLLNMTPRQRHAEMERRKQAGGVEGTLIYSERAIKVAEEAYEKMLAAGHERATITERYLDHIEHEDNLKLSRGEALYAILMYEQPTYTERMEAAGYTPEVIDGLKAYIGEDMLQFGYGLREMFAQQGDRIAAIFEREFGVPFPREKNYFAARWNVTAMKDTPAEDLLASMAGTPGSSKGFLKSRVNHNLELDMTKDALQVFLQATTVTDAWMATQDIVADFKAWTRDPRFERALVGLIGRDEYQNLVEWIRLVEQGGAMDSLHMGTAQEAINKLYGSGAVAILGLRIQTLLRQVPSVVNGLLGAADISTAEWLATLSRMKHGDAPMTYQRMIDSQLIKNRQQARMSTMENQALRTHDQQSSPVESLLTEAMRPMEWMDARLTALSLVPVWNVYYTRAMNAGSSHQEAEQIAWEQTAIVANLSAQPIGIFNRSKLMQSRNAIVRAVFYMLSENTAKLGLFCALCKQGKGWAALRAWLYYGALNAAISALLDYLQGDPEKWERGTWLEYLFSALYGPAAALPLIGELLEALTTGLARTIGEATDWDALKKARGHASVGKTIVDLGGTIRALTSLAEMLTDEKDHTLAEYTRAVSTVSRSTAIATGWLGNGISYWSSAVAVLMNPIDFVARVWRNLKHYSE